MPWMWTLWHVWMLFTFINSCWYGYIVHFSCHYIVFHNTYASKINLEKIYIWCFFKNDRIKCNIFIFIIYNYDIFWISKISGNTISSIWFFSCIIAYNMLKYYINKLFNYMGCLFSHIKKWCIKQRWNSKRVSKEILKECITICNIFNMFYIISRYGDNNGFTHLFLINGELII